MINEKHSISMDEAREYLVDDERDKETKAFTKKFVGLDVKKSKELRKKLEELDLMKVKESDISKVIEILPENSEELNKIFNDVGLDEDETKKILDTVKEFK
jgi:DNA-directed RNA polymerase subunit F|tara:strand:+ start:30585 stop:30887 length:303 start_codon:yes stop_codon:yes gene_type:complete